MRKAGFLCVMVLAAAAAGDAAAGPAACPGLEARLAALDHADRQQWEGDDLAADPYAIERERSAVLRELAANRCGSVEVKRNKRPNGPLAGLFRNKRPFRNGPFREGGLFGGGNGLFGQGSYGNDFSYGSYRTLCVRTCDGYYFPISFSASGGELQRDETACRALCPGKEVALYVQPNPGQEGGAMVSLAGEPYTALPTAFRYRSEYNRECACGPVDPATAAAFQAFSMPPPVTSEIVLPPPPEMARPLIPAPPARAAADDPETLANRAGRLVPGPVSREPVAEATYRQGPDGRVVRLVGPEASYLAE